MENIKIKGLEDGDLSKFSIKELHLQDLHNQNIQSGHLKNIAKSGGESVGKTAHLRLNEAQTSESRKKSASKRKIVKRVKKLILNKDEIISELKKNYFIKDVANFFKLSLSTFRKILKESNIEYKEYLLEVPDSIKKQKYSSYGGYKTKKEILCFYYPSMKPFIIKKFSSIKEAGEYFGGGAISKVLSNKQNSINFNGIKVTFKKVEK